MEPIWIVGIVVFLVAVYVFSMYNRLVRVDNHCDEAWSNIDTELKRRYNLIPNLVSVVKGYARHEQEILEEVTRLRERCMHDAGSPAHQAATENPLIGALGKLMVRLEQYPELKANRNFLDLQQELINTEDRIQAARRFYNGNVREQQNRVEMFPSSIVAGIGGFQCREFFEIEDLSVRATPVVDLTGSG